MRSKIESKIRWLIVDIMDRFNDTCRVELGMWANAPELHDFWDILDMRNTARGCGYCGKCEVVGNPCKCHIEICDVTEICKD